MPITNPNNALGTNAAYSGRTSVNAFNDVAAVLSRGVLSGWKCVPGTGLKVKIGGDASVRDVAIAEDNAGNKTTINNRTKSAVEVTLPGAPGANSRIDAVVAYVDPTVQGSADAADNPNVVGLVVVSGAAAAAPQMPSDTEIRSAITGDGANGTSAFYVVLAAVTMKTSMTTVTANEIRQVDRAVVGTDNVDWATSAALPPVTFSGNRANNNETYGDMTGTYTIPADGLYEIYADTWSASAGATQFTMGIKLLKNSEKLLEKTGIVSVANYAANNFANFTATLSFYAKQEEVIKLQSKVDESKWTGRISHSSRIKRLV